MKIPYLSLEYQNKLIREEALAAMAAVFDANWYILGEQLNAFEKAYAAFTGTKYCCGVGNGFDALYMALKVLGIIQAALLQVKLPYINQWTAERQYLPALYDSTLPDLAELILPKTAPGATHVYHIYQVRTTRRDELQKFLFQKGIETQIHYPVPPHLQKAYAPLHLAPGTFPITEEIAATGLSLPLWPGLQEIQVSYISTCIREFFRK